MTQQMEMHEMLQFTGQSGAFYTISENPFAGGGEGGIYNVRENSQLVAKIYQSAKRSSDMKNAKNCLITLVDCDSFHITDARGRVFRCPVGKPEFVAPELQGKNLTSSSKFQQDDNIKNGICPYFTISANNNITIPPYAPTLFCLPGEIALLFFKAFILGHKQPSLRQIPGSYF
jgi:DNA-binding helix-hairpin-helix protein with protein kinase domain